MEIRLHLSDISTEKYIHPEIEDEATLFEKIGIDESHPGVKALRVGDNFTLENKNYEIKEIEVFLGSAVAPHDKADVRVGIRILSIS
ncbi:hypothetical protein [Pontibacter beigongshangensis]|uniref:hypothetical protein n=1 Tax=Pontibacter beigongshangensis TaxID=2574733 RepID=UPI0016508008|nr:hypothetical protein [Pontibacter beigongshangensis]